MLDVFFKGGVMMWPLLLASIAALAVAIERFIALRGKDQDVTELIEDVRFAVEQGRIIEAVQIARRSRSPVSGLLVAALSNIGKPKAEIEEEIAVAGRMELRRLERYLPVLDLIVTIAPLMGLLGTVLGIIKAFNVLAASAGLADAGALSAGIAEALITTAAGLIIAIPAQVVYTYLISMVDRAVAAMNSKSVEIISLAAGAQSDDAI